MSCGIYKIENLLNNKKYIGQSVHIEKRWEEEVRDSSNNKTRSYNYPLQQAFRKYGINNFSFEILEEVNSDLLNEREMFWIAKYNSYVDGYNQTPGGERLLGEENPNAKLSENDVRYIRQQLLNGKMLSEVYSEFQNKISRKGFVHIWRGESWPNIMPEAIEFLKTEQYKTSVKKFCSDIGHSKTKEWREDIAIRKNRGESRDSVYEDYKDKYTKNGFYDLWYRLPINQEYNNHKKKTREVIKIDKDTLIPLQKYNSIAEAARENNCDASSIAKVCKNQKKSCNGFIWRYAE